MREFLSTPSARRATNAWRNLRESFGISIHALREEGDQQRHGQALTCGNFYPRPPRGGRLLPGELSGDTNTISIHALREEGDHWRIPPPAGL